MIYNSLFDIAGILISITVISSFFANRIVVTRKSNSFITLLIIIMITSILNSLSIYFLNNPENISRAGLYLLNLGYFITYNSIPIVFIFLTYYSTEDSKPEPLWLKIIVLILGLSFLLILLTNQYTHFVFVITKDKQYIRPNSYGILVLYGIAAISFLFAITHIIINFKKFKIYQFITLLAFSFLSGVSAFIQLLFPYFMISGLVLSVSTFLIYFVMEDPELYIDAETSTLNRQALIANIKQYCSTKSTCKLLEIHIAELEYLINTIGAKNKSSITQIVSDFLIETFDKKSVFRNSNDEFVIIIKNPNPIILYSQIEEIRNRFELPFITNNIEVSLSALFTIISIPDDANTVENLMELLDFTFEDVSNTERNRLNPANLSLISKRHRNQIISSHLERAVSINDFEVYYQPIYRLSNNEITSAEALIRFKTDNPELGYISPAEFIPLAEKNGMILKIGNFVLTEVAKFASSENLKSYGIDQIHINLSIVQLLQKNLSEQFFKILDNYHTDYNFINLEISETELVLSNPTVQKNAREFHSKGISLSLDDYGTGYSNIASLLSLSYKDITLDKTMLWDTLKDDKARIILKQTISMIKKLGLQVICKGIETEIQKEVLKDTDCSFVQGFYYSEPLKKEEFIELIKKQKEN